MRGTTGCSIFVFTVLLSMPVIAQNVSPCQPNVLLVSVLDAHGSPVRDLRKEDFLVEVDKHAAVVSSADYQLLPRRVVLVLDLSGSMTARGNPNKWDLTRTAVQTFLSMTPPQVPVALLGFSDKVVATFGFGSERSAILGWLDKIDGATRANGGASALYDGLLAGFKMLEPHQEGDSIYVITDGIDNYSQPTSRGTLNDELLRSRVRLFTFLLADQKLPVEYQLALGTGPRRDTAIKNMAEVSGGFNYGLFATSGTWFTSFETNQRVQETIKAQSAQLNVQVAGFYPLTLTASPAFRDGAHVSVDVIDVAAKKRKGLTVTFPRKLSGCPTALAN